GGRRQAGSLLGQDQGSAAKIGLFLLFALDHAQPLQRRGHDLALEGADVGHGVGAFGGRAGAHAEHKRQGKSEQSGPGYGLGGGPPPVRVTTHETSLIPTAPARTWRKPLPVIRHCASRGPYKPSTALKPDSGSIAFTLACGPVGGRRSPV